MTFKVIWGIDALPADINRDDLPNNGRGKRYSDYLVVEHAGKTVACLSSAMEPEDATFGRDLSEVVDVLKVVYLLGKEAATPKPTRLAPQSPSTPSPALSDTEVAKS